MSMMCPPQRVKMTSIPSALSAFATRWPPEMSSDSSAAGVFAPTSNNVLLIAVSLSSSFFSGSSCRQVVHLLGNVPGQIQSVLAHQSLGQLGVASLERFDDLQVVDDRPVVPLVLTNRAAAERLHVDEQAARHVDEKPGS